MATTPVTPASAVNDKPDAKVVKTRKVELTINEHEDVLVIHADLAPMLKAAFGLQEDIENESKFIRAFVFDAVRNGLSAFANRVIGDWDRLIEKSSKLHPSKTREDVAKELMVSKRARAVSEFAVKAREVKAKLKA